METEIEKLYLLDLNVQIAKPFIDVFHVLLLDIFKLVRVEIDLSTKNRDLELAAVDLKVAVYNRKGAPSQNDVLGDVIFRREINDLKHDDVGWK